MRACFCNSAPTLQCGPPQDAVTLVSPLPPAFDHLSICPHGFFWSSFLVFALPLFQLLWFPMSSNQLMSIFHVAPSHERQACPFCSLTLISCFWRLLDPEGGGSTQPTARKPATCPEPVCPRLIKPQINFNSNRKILVIKQTKNRGKRGNKKWKYKTDKDGSITFSQQVVNFGTFKTKNNLPKKAVNKFDVIS